MTEENVNNNENLQNQTKEGGRIVARYQASIDKDLWVYRAE